MERQRKPRRYPGRRAALLVGFAGASVLLWCTASAATDRVPGGKTTMTDADMEQALRALPDDDRQEAAFAARLREESVAPARSLEALWRRNDALSAKALRILIQLDDSVIGPTITAPPPSEPERQVQIMRIAVDAETAQRKRLVSAVERMLSDKRELPPQAMVGPAERRPPVRRVCDEAYLFMRELVHFGEDEVAFMVGRDQFLHLPAELRDREIDRARKTGTWRRAVYGEGEDDPGGPATKPPGGAPPRR